MGEEKKKDVLFERFLACATEEMPTQDLKDQVAEGLRKRRVKPPVAVMEQVLRKRLSDEKANQIMFYPDAQEASLYPLLLQNAPTGSQQDHPQTKSQILFLGPLYLVHRKNWEFMRPFILAGGLRALVNMFLHDNLHLRGQAIEVFRNLTSEETFPWHDGHKLSAEASSSSSSLSSGRQDQAKEIMGKMFELTQAGIIPKLVANYSSPFPNASFLCLSILAFYASFLRVNYCKDNILQLSENLLKRLEEWSQRKDVSQEERDLAKTMHDDFGRFEPAKLPEDGEKGSNRGKRREEEEEEEFMMYRVKEDRTQVNHVETKSEAEVWKEKGNSAYKDKDWSLAIECYSKAMDVPVTQEQLLTEGPRRAIFHCNRAAAYLARAKETSLPQAAEAPGAGTCDAMGHLEGVDVGSLSEEERSKMNFKAALMDCDQALDLESGNVKGRYRKAQALKGLGRYQESIDAAISALHVAPKGILEKEINALLSDLKLQEEEKENKQKGGDESKKEKEKAPPLIQVISSTSNE